MPVMEVDPATECMKESPRTYVPIRMAGFLVVELITIRDVDPLPRESNQRREEREMCCTFRDKVEENFPPLFDTLIRTMDRLPLIATRMCFQSN